jgi:hypothetical protein
MATGSGVACVIAGGEADGVVPAAVAGQAVGTRFAPSDCSGGAFKMWLRHAKPAQGRVVVDAGAVRALIDFTAPVHDRLGLGPFLGGIPVMLEHGNGAQRQAREFTSGGDLVAMHASAAERTRRSAEEALELIGMVSTT